MLKPRNAKQRTFLQLQRKLGELGAKLEKALNKMVQCVEEDGGVLYAKFNQTVTRTHRLSSTGKKYGIQFQNMFREFKPLFRAKHNEWLIGEGDGAQLEFRIAAWYGQDERATEDIKHGFDVHQFTADTLTEAKQPTTRQEAKAHTFKPLFGGSSGTKAEQTYYKAFREKYPGIDAAQERWITEVLRTKRLVLPTGMIFYWPDTQLQPSGYVTNTTNISNYPIQYLATGEIIPIAVTYLWHRLREAGAATKIVNTVHDSAIAEVHPSETELYQELVVKAFTDDVYNYLREVYGIDFNVPLEAEVKVQHNWSDSDTWRTKWVEKHENSQKKE
jgi:DNA polymerase I-like protein with 3'-5' exonuclease and polymerase domains